MEEVPAVAEVIQAEEEVRAVADILVAEAEVQAVVADIPAADQVVEAADTATSHRESFFKDGLGRERSQ